jgi:hypothetical protein
MTNNPPNSKTLTAIGYWQSNQDQELPHPKKFINDQISIEERTLLIRYLERGKVLMRCLGYSFCRFDCGTPDHEMGAADLTDGNYVWPEKLSHYISNHNVWLPEPFILHVKTNENYNPEDINLKSQNFDVKTIFNRKWWKSCQSLK